MSHFPSPLLTLESLVRARGAYGKIMSGAINSANYSEVWDAHRPTLARLNEADATYALPFLARLQLADPSNWDLLDDREVAHPCTELVEALTTLLADYEQIFGDGSYFIPILKGVVAYIDGFEHVAFEQFARINGEDRLYDVVKDDFAGAACARPLLSARGVKAFSGQAGFPSICVHHRTARLDQSLLSIAMDTVYFRAFTPGWLPVVEALRAHGIGCHFHLIAKTQDEVKLLDPIAEWATANDISCILTFELAQPIDRAYFTVRRFFAARTIMELTSASLMILDADLAVEDPGAIAGLFARDEGVTVAFSSGPWHGYLPWRRISGGVVLLPACAETRRYLQLVTDFIEYFWLANDSRHWWIDQMALECARLTAVKQWPGVFVRDFGKPVWDIFCASEEYKIAQLSRLPEVDAATAKGVDWNSALRQIQLST